MEFVKRFKNSTDSRRGEGVLPLMSGEGDDSWCVATPTVNAQWTDSEIIVKHYVNFGIAAATPRGLIVPNIKEAQELCCASCLRDRAAHDTARDGKDEVRRHQGGGTITVTNIGVFGHGHGARRSSTPGGRDTGDGHDQAETRGWWMAKCGRVSSRLLGALCLDHRIVDGDVASRFLADVA
jgi:pyruvate dehydrogenase E2 component (dihydrolipoamide acetyltransferase)